MITGERKIRMASLWDDFAAGGIVNPLTVIEQITYLMFIHDLDEADNKGSMEAMMLGISHESIFKDKVEVEGRTVDGKQLKWSVFQDFPAEKMFDVVKNEVFPFIINLHSDRESAYSKYMSDAIFMIPTPLLLSKVVEKLSDLFRMMKETKLDKEDVRGDVYEYLLSKLNTAGRNGQFRTPRHIIKMMVELMQPKPDEIICDPACGTSGFLIAASEYLMEDEERKREVLFDKENKEHYLNHMFHGYDMDRTMLRIGAMNMMAHGIDNNPCIEYKDSLFRNEDKNKYSLVLANPPFKGSLGLRYRLAGSAENLQDEEDGASVRNPVPSHAENRRSLCLHRSGRGAVRFFEGTQVHPKGNRGEQPSGSRNLYAFRRIQTVRGRIYGDPYFYQNRSRRNGSRLVLRHAKRWPQSG